MVKNLMFVFGGPQEVSWEFLGKSSEPRVHSSALISLASIIAEASDPLLPIVVILKFLLIP